MKLIRSFFHSSLCLLPLLSGCAAASKYANAEPEMTSPDASAAMTLPQAYGAKTDLGAVDPNSTWVDSASNLYSNKRTHKVGDILTVQIAMNDQAQLFNKTNRNRNGAKSLGVNGAFSVAGVGKSANMDAALKNSTDFAGSGGVTRSETVKIAIAAAVTAVYPNGNLLISGSQEVMVNSELRILRISGIINNIDIQPDNTISHDRIVDARISYGGKGQISEVQKPAYGQSILDSISPL